MVHDIAEGRLQEADCDPVTRAAQDVTRSFMLRRTKIVATIGPASSSPAVLRDLFAAGLNIARVTLAHGSLESQQALVRLIRDEADAAKQSVDPRRPPSGRKFGRRRSPEPLNPAWRSDHPRRQRARRRRRYPGTRRGSVDYPTLARDVEVGDTLGIGDGIVHLLVDGRDATSLSARVTHGGRSLVARCQDSH